MPKINLMIPKQREKGTNKDKYQKIYQDPRWKRIRRLKFQMNPLCEICESEGITNITEEIHHVIPFQSESDSDEIEKLAFDISNTQSLCIEHHKSVDKLIRRSKKVR
jgi:5-methylcytosine-specific restriction endonuclease McrA